MEAVIEWAKDWGGWLFGAMASIVAIRASVKFDINKWLEDRDNRKSRKVQQICPHTRITKDQEGNYAVRSSFISPSGRSDWQCQMCGVITYDRDQAAELANYYAENPMKLIEQHKKLDKLLD